MTKWHTTVWRLVVAQFRAMSLLISCCSSADDWRVFLPLCDMRAKAQRLNSFLMSPIGHVSLKARHVPFPGQLGGQYDDASRNCYDGSVRSYPCRKSNPNIVVV